MHGRLLAVWALTLAACTRPGVRSDGAGDAVWGGREPERWAGRCAYEVHTRWATSLPHVVTLTAQDADWSLVIAARRRLPTGHTSLSANGEGGVQGLVLQGATVQGVVLGSLDVERRDDSTFIAIVGTKAYRDTVPLQAGCRLGALAGQGDS